MITARQDLNNTSFHTEHDKKQSLTDKILELNMPSAPLVLTMSTTRAKHQHIGWIWIERCIVIPKEPYQTHSQSLIWLFFLYQHDQPLTPIVGQTFFSYKTNNPSITSLRSVTTDSREESRRGGGFRSTAFLPLRTLFSFLLARYLLVSHQYAPCATLSYKDGSVRYRHQYITAVCLRVTADERRVADVLLASLSSTDGVRQSYPHEHPQTKVLCYVLRQDTK